MRLRELIVIAIVLSAASCGTNQGPASKEGGADASQAVQLGGAPTGAGTLEGDIGEIQPTDPASTSDPVKRIALALLTVAAGLERVLSSMQS